jgi:hypothetical protein
VPIGPCWAVPVGPCQRTGSQVSGPSRTCRVLSIVLRFFEGIEQIQQLVIARAISGMHLS